ncbi:MAG: acetyl-CoA carboxylase biotin carboxyl carrier protein subunit [Pseudonocardiales bacterium]|nr:acetyl-CoA carboxylase biotin carboxyl carrier protein subunit [Pseudonocardiales bacterium]
MTHRVSAELVGNVGEVLVDVGVRVAPTDPIVMLESMKMEIPILAEVSGVVDQIMVAVGDVVQEGDLIAVIVPDR